MTPPDAAPDPATPEVLARQFPNLTARFGPLTPMDQGMQSRVYTTPGGEIIVKVYRNQRGEHRLEAQNMRRADMGDWVIDTLETDGVEALVMRRFSGHPLTPADVTRALPRLREILGTLHAEKQGRVNLQRVHERLQRFRSALNGFPLDDLFTAVEGPLDEGLLEQPAAFCHLDLWQDNILIDPDSGDVLVIDWTKATWDDPLRDLALLKTGTLDLLSADASLGAALTFLPDQERPTLVRYRAYLALTTLHDLYWFLMNEPYEFDLQRERKLRRARHALSRLPAGL